MKERKNERMKSELKTLNSKLRIPNSELRPPNLPDADAVGRQAQNPEPRTKKTLRFRKGFLFILADRYYCLMNFAFLVSPFSFVEII